MAVGARALSYAGILLVIVSLLAAVGCVPASTSSGEQITAHLLIEADAYPRWYRGLEVIDGTDGYELLEIALDGEIESEWFPEYRSHFVKTILTVEPKGAEFWGVFVWNETTSGWEPLPIGADLFSVKDGHVMAWALVEYNPDQPQLPTSVP